MKQSANNQIEQIIMSVTLRIFNLFNNNPNYINNITGIAKEIGMAHITIRKYLKAMIDLDILSELSVGRNGKVFTLNKDSSTTRAFNDFIEILRSNVK